MHETFPTLLNELVDDPDIGAVTVDLDINICFMKIMRAIIYLQRPDVLFLAGATDIKVPLTVKSDIIGKFVVSQNKKYSQYLFISSG